MASEWTERESGPNTIVQSTHHIQKTVLMCQVLRTRDTVLHGTLQDLFCIRPLFSKARDVAHFPRDVAHFPNTERKLDKMRQQDLPIQRAI